LALPLVAVAQGRLLRKRKHLVQVITNLIQVVLGVLFFSDGKSRDVAGPLAVEGAKVRLLEGRVSQMLSVSASTCSVLPVALWTPLIACDLAQLAGPLTPLTGKRRQRKRIVLVQFLLTIWEESDDLEWKTTILPLRLGWSLSSVWCCAV